VGHWGTARAPSTANNFIVLINFGAVRSMSTDSMRLSVQVSRIRSLFIASIKGKGPVLDIALLHDEHMLYNLGSGS